MIIDILSNAKKYFCVNPFFRKAFEFLQSTDLNEIQEGNYEIDGENLRAIVSCKPGKSTEESLAKFECHNKHIDIQLCINGKEQIGWKPRQTCRDQKSDYDQSNDVTFYNDAPDTFFTLTDQQFAVFFPEDVHAPMIGNGKIKKVVLKVKI